MSLWHNVQGQESGNSTPSAFLDVAVPLSCKFLIMLHYVHA